MSEGPDRYRRGLYTFSKRTAPYAMFSTFDGPSGEACVAQRDVSDTPLQALTLLNDTVIVEVAQALGRRFATRDGSVECRLEQLFRRCLVRYPDADERRLLEEFLNHQRQRFANARALAEPIAGKGAGGAECAAWTALARVLLNLDETVTRN